MPAYRYPLPFVEGSGFAIVGGTVQLAINQDGAAATYELADDPLDMAVRAYFRVATDVEPSATDDPDPDASGEVTEEGTDYTDDSTAEAAEE